MFRKQKNKPIFSKELATFAFFHEPSETPKEKKKVAGHFCHDWGTHGLSKDPILHKNITTEYKYVSPVSAAIQ